MGDKNKQITFSHKWLNEDGEIFTGTFTARRLTIMDRSKMSVRKNQLSGGFYCVRDEDGVPTGQGLDPDTDYVNLMIAHLETALVQKPIWFKFEDLMDMGLVAEVYDKVLDFEMTFFDEETGTPLSGLQQVEAAKKTAATNLQAKDLRPQLRRWWVQKYKLPWTHETAQQCTYFELLVEFYEDYFENNKAAYYKEFADADGHFKLPETGDDLIDKWEHELAMGLTPDLEEGLTSKTKADLAKEKAKAIEKKIYRKAMGHGFSESYTPENIAAMNAASEPKPDVQNKLLGYAKSGGLENMDPATVSRMLDSLTPEQAHQIIQVLKTKT